METSDFFSFWVCEIRKILNYSATPHQSLPPPKTLGMKKNMQFNNLAVAERKLFQEHV